MKNILLKQRKKIKFYFIRNIIRGSKKLNMDAIQWIKEAEENGELAIDTETTSLDPHQADLVGISMSTKIGKACYIPISHSSGNCLDKKKVINKLKPLLEDKSVKKIGCH